MAVTLEDARTHLGIDYPDEVTDGNITRALLAARATLLGAVGEDLEAYMPDDARADELICIYLNDLYSERGVSAKVSGATRRIVADMELQLKMELRTAKEAAR